MFLLAALELSLALSQVPSDTIFLSEKIDFSIEVEPAGVVIDASQEPLPRYIYDRHEATGRLLLGTWDSHRLALYDSAGGLLEDLNRQGEGPGELTHVVTAGFGPGDSVWVLDDGVVLERFDPDLIHIGSTRLPGFFAKAVVGRFAYVIGMEVGAEADFGHPVHQLGEDSIIRSFGKTPERQVFTSFRRTWDRTPTIGPEGRIWLAHHSDYVIEVRSPSGVLEEVLKADRWFPPRPWPTPTTKIRREPDQRIRRLAFGPQGYLWVESIQPDKRWTEALEERGEDFWRRYDIAVDVIDVRLGSIIASGRYDEAVFAGFLPGGYSQFSDDPDQIHLLRLTVRRKP